MVQFKPIEGQINNDMTGYHRLFGVYLHGKLDMEAGYDIVFARNCKTETVKFYSLKDYGSDTYVSQEYEQAAFDAPCIFKCEVVLDTRVAEAIAFIWKDKSECPVLDENGKQMFPDEHRSKYCGLIVAPDDYEALKDARESYDAETRCL